MKRPKVFMSRGLELGWFEYGSAATEVMLFLPEDNQWTKEDFEQAVDIEIKLHFHPEKKEIT